jgi:hypothetical protein
MNGFKLVRTIAMVGAGAPAASKCQLLLVLLLLLLLVFVAKFSFVSACWVHILPHTALAC